MQKLTSASQCQMSSTFGTSSDHQSVSTLREEEKSLENNEKSRDNIHEILHEFTKFYSNQKLMIDLKPKASSANIRLHEILKTSSNQV